MSTISVDRDARVLTLTINNPPHNFLTTAMIAELRELLTSVEHDPTIGALVLTSALDGVFIAHADVSEILGGPDDFSVAISPAVARGLLRTQGAIEHIPGVRSALGQSPAAGLSALLQINQTFALIQRLDKVVIAAINGTAMGGGSELALCCDIRIMVDGDFALGQPEICVGIIPGAGGTQRLSRAIGHARALELMLDGRPVDPAEAKAIGYVHHVVAPDEFSAFVSETAHRLARRPAAAVAAIKRTVNGDAALARGLAAERAAFIASVSTKQARAAMRAYLDRLDELDARGEALNADALRPWLQGTAYQFHP
jgi:enoyl-CoA hydratase